MPRRALALTLALLVVVALAVFVPFVTEERAIPVSTAATPPLFAGLALVDVPPGERACIEQVLLDPEADIARLRVGTFGRPGPPLALALEGAGYRERQGVRGGYADNALLEVALDGPSRELIGRACIANEGERPVALYGTSEGRTQSRVAVEVDGEPVPDVALAFYEREPQTLAERMPEALELMTAFRPFGPWLTWPLFVLVLIGMPALALWALHRAFQARPVEPADQPNAATSRRASAITRG